MKEWQKRFLDEIFLKEYDIKEGDFDDVFEFLLKQTTYARKRTILNFVSLVKKSVQDPQTKRSVNYRMLQAKAREYMSSIRPRYEIAFTLGKEYIHAYQTFFSLQKELTKINENILQMERTWEESQTGEEPTTTVEMRDKVQPVPPQRRETVKQMEDNAKQTKIELLGLNPASYNRLKRMSIDTIYQLCSIPEEQLSAIKGIGVKNFECIKQCLHARGYQIGMFC